MKIPMKWLREYVGIACAPEEYAAKMVMAGNGVEGIQHTGAQFDGVIVGVIRAIEKHADSDHLLICQVDVGAEAPIQIVTGAPNVHEGACVPVALDGARLPGGVTIKAGKLRGVASMGMMCSGPELEIPEGLYPHCGEAGILLFQEQHLPGTDVKEIFGLGDAVVDFEVLANRPDCLSVWGMARESAAVLERDLTLPQIHVQEAAGPTVEESASVTVLDDDLCPRYCARAVRGVRIGPSPMWLREYLHGAGVRPINNIVDITNFVMLETGHPMHAFDLAKVRDRAIIVRRAQEGEQLRTLDGKEHTLTGEMLVIADAERATGLAGIMGGEESEITADTREVLFECAAFDRTSIRLTSRALGIRTESSGRFEKGVCAATAMQALSRACMLVNALGCGEIAPGAIDLYPHPAPPRVVRAEVARVNALISAGLSAEEMAAYLERLHIRTAQRDGALLCRIPEYRGDLEGEADIAEEVLRLHGYDKIPSTLMRGETVVGKRSERQRLLDRVKGLLVGMGCYEALTYSFISPKWLAMLSLPAGDERLVPIMVRNPLGEDTAAMRTTLVPSMLATLATNIKRGSGAGRLFEVAAAFFPNGGEDVPAQERLTLCVGLYGAQEDFYALKDIVVCLLNDFGVRHAIRAGGDPYFHPGRKAMAMVGEACVAQLGEVHPDTAAQFGIERRVYVAQLSLDALAALATPMDGIKPLPRFPAVTRDLALVMDERVPVGDLMETARRAGGAWMEEIHLFDIYRGAQLGEGHKNVAFSLSFRAPDRTLVDEDIAAAMEGILAACARDYGAQIRQ